MAANERFFPAPIPAGRGGFFPAPFQFVLTGEDNLRVAISNSVAGVTIVIQGRFLRAGESQAQAFSHSFQPGTTGMEEAFDVPMGEGVILNLVARAIGERVERGECYVRVDVIRGLTGATIVLGTLIAGYVGSWAGIAWPGSPLESPVDGRGCMKWVQGAAPGSASEAFLDLPNETRWRVVAVRIVLVTSAVVGNRLITLGFLQRGGIVFAVDSSVVQTASATRAHNFGAGSSFTTATGFNNGAGAFPVETYLSTRGALDATIRTFTVGLQAGDQYSAISALVEEWRNTASVAV